jgi:hypothetical protein
MHPNALRITEFYEGFSRLDPAPMVKLYAPHAHFSDPAFPNLNGDEVTDMWTMLCRSAKDFSLTFSGVNADDTSGSAHWEARYLFGGKRPVHNIIDAKFVFRDGLVIDHVDTFDFYRWSKQAMGPLGLLLGWTPILPALVQGRTRTLLASYRARKGR